MKTLRFVRNSSDYFLYTINFSGKNSIVARKPIFAYLLGARPAAWRHACWYVLGLQICCMQRQKGLNLLCSIILYSLNLSWPICWEFEFILLVTTKYVKSFTFRNHSSVHVYVSKILVWSMGILKIKIRKTTVKRELKEFSHLSGYKTCTCLLSLKYLLEAPKFRRHTSQANVCCLFNQQWHWKRKNVGTIRMM
jgi:hypothetical protein